VADDYMTESNIETEGMTVDVETHAPHAHKTGHNWVDLVVAISALFVSVVSLGIAVLHGRTIERMAEENARLVADSSLVADYVVRAGEQIEFLEFPSTKVSRRERPN
jgi:methanogenic corrinoid protein MtbC1